MKCLKLAVLEMSDFADHMGIDIPNSIALPFETNLKASGLR